MSELTIVFVKRESKAWKVMSFPTPWKESTIGY